MQIYDWTDIINWEKSKSLEYKNGIIYETKVFVMDLNLHSMLILINFAKMHSMAPILRPRVGRWWVLAEELRGNLINWTTLIAVHSHVHTGMWIKLIPATLAKSTRSTVGGSGVREITVANLSRDKCRKLRRVGYPLLLKPSWIKPNRNGGFSKGGSISVVPMTKKGWSFIIFIWSSHCTGFQTKKIPSYSLFCVFSPSFTYLPIIELEYNEWKYGHRFLKRFEYFKY